jgi:hypothetical protein
VTFYNKVFPFLPLAMKAYLEHGIKNLTHSRPQLHIQVKILITYSFGLLAGETV